ncbi:DUF3267 domain-containing protein [Natronococcus sp. A-GB7]|uniref:DUF3267 domain-containing protein n=1 Tax=Natronococcus sp. A-GB7 TaxID=3037649 RepID=UPI00241C8288|nr:DUF3267 domain-containing protein [Natronococcus sp. A-GB7]MDG5818971.1 DUF3267 domain-containing protein [Natronococcus sp. A-GB7]
MTDKDPIEAAEAKARGVSPPPTPEGYSEPYQFEYPKLLVTVAAMAVTVVSTVVYGWLLVQLQGPEILPVVFEVGAEEEITILFNLTGTAIPLLFAFLTVAVVHELLHGVVYQRYGYEVSYGVYWRFGAVYAAVFHQFHSREHNLRVGIAPLAIITLICLPLLAVPQPVIATTAFFVLVLNTGGAMGDAYALWRFYRMPRGTVFYDINADNMYVFEPMDRPE